MEKATTKSFGSIKTNASVNRLAKIVYLKSKVTIWPRTLRENFYRKINYKCDIKKDTIHTRKLTA